MTALNIIQIADVVKTLGKQALLYKVLSKNGVKSGNFISMYKNMPRASRKRLAEEILMLDERRVNKKSKNFKAGFEWDKIIR